MRLRVELGIGGTLKEFNWWRGFPNGFPNFLQHGGKKWEWITYTKDVTKQVDFILLFTEIPSYDPNYYISDMESLDSIVGTSHDNSCSCGAVYTSFPFDHMRYCAKWRRWEWL